ncbi:hypothetical protein RMSM_06018 [Rhodopirellula maiorica SM1]|uniref:Uncharacterized protein n=1 Tax=Rhodopirellula maiorica SM1 TaxID=1265738 RepID=M5RSW0_9BACT|nr:hypothetical protein RMSM_06018 [Rhodopirellula maiorica SM1]
MELLPLTIQVPSTESLLILPLHLLGVLLFTDLELQQKVILNAADYLCVLATTTARDRSDDHDWKHA